MTTGQTAITHPALASSVGGTGWRDGSLAAAGGHAGGGRQVDGLAGDGDGDKGGAKATVSIGRRNGGDGARRPDAPAEGPPGPRAVVDTDRECPKPPASTIRL